MDLPLLPNEILLMIAEDNVMALYKMSIAVPFIGRMMLGEKRTILLSKHTKIVRDCRGSRYFIRHNGKYILHREDGPAMRNKCGKEYRKEWYKWGVLHREDLPAYISYNAHHDLYRFIWYQRGKILEGIFISPRDKMIASWNHDCEAYRYINYNANIALITSLLEFSRRALGKN